MATRNPPKQTLIESIAKRNHDLDCTLKRRFGVGLKTYKTIKAVTQLASVATGFYAISQGADPTTTYALVAAILVGPEAVETVITNATTDTDSRRTNR